MTALELRRELKAALMSGAPDRATGLEWCRAVDAVINAALDESRAPSPITEWLRRKPELHFLTSEAEMDGTIVARLHDDDTDEEFTVGIGRGDTHEEATAAACNNAFVREN
jgi:hypothetical protein